jgi:hypothetical protein
MSTEMDDRIEDSDIEVSYLACIDGHGREAEILRTLQAVCAFRCIRPLIPIAFAHLVRSIRPPVTRCREAVQGGYQILGFSSSFLAMVFRMDAPSSSMRYAL